MDGVYSLSMAVLARVAASPRSKATAGVASPDLVSGSLFGRKRLFLPRGSQPSRASLAGVNRLSLRVNRRAGGVASSGSRRRLLREVAHRLINRSPWAVELVVWALPVMAPGGRAIYPQADFIPHPDLLAPARPLVLWHFTDMSHPRWTCGRRHIQLRQDPGATTNQKVGMLNRIGWAAYLPEGDVFIERYPYQPGRTSITSSRGSWRRSKAVRPRRPSTRVSCRSSARRPDRPAATRRQSPRPRSRSGAVVHQDARNP
jgi:hypothetical protein